MSQYYASKSVTFPTTYRRVIWAISKTNGSYQLYDDTGTLRYKARGTDIRLGTGVHNWKLKIARGEDATSPFTGQKQWMVEGPPAYYLAKYQNPWDWIYTEYYGAGISYEGSIPGHAFSSSDITSVGNQALGRFLKKLRGRQTSFQGLVFTGELRETLRWLKSPLKGVRDLLESYFIDVYTKNGRYKKRDRLKRSSDLWLEYSFGISPLVSDLQDAVKAYRKLGERDKREKITAFSSMENFTDYGKETASGVGDLPMLQRMFDKGILTVRYSAGLRCQAELAPHDDALLRFGLTTQHIGAALWELTPWSFLVDYFSNVGDIIEAGLTNTSDLTWGCKTVRIESHRHITYEANIPQFLAGGPDRTVVGNPGYIELRSRTISRSAIGSLVPSLTFEVPGLGSKWLNMAALVGARSRALLSF